MISDYAVLIIVIFSGGVMVKKIDPPEAEIIKLGTKAKPTSKTAADIEKIVIDLMALHNRIEAIADLTPFERYVRNQNENLRTLSTDLRDLLENPVAYPPLKEK